MARSADDVSTIRARMQELKRERDTNLFRPLFETNLPADKKPEQSPPSIASTWGWMGVSLYPVSHFI